MNPHELAEKSGIEAYLTSSAEEQAAGQENVFKYEVVRRMGYFSMMQLLRMRLLGDYQMALETVQNGAGYTGLGLRSLIL